MKDEELEELQVVWEGWMELLPPRSQRPDPTWGGVKRVYNRKAVTTVTTVDSQDPSPSGEAQGDRV